MALTITPDETTEKLVTEALASLSENQRALIEHFHLAGAKRPSREEFRRNHKNQSKKSNEEIDIELEHAMSMLRGWFAERDLHLCDIL